MSNSRFLPLSCGLLFFAGGAQAESILYLQGDTADFLWGTYAAGYGTPRADNNSANGTFTYSFTDWSAVSDINQSIDIRYRRDDTRYSFHDDWALQFSPPRGSFFEPGLYEPAARFPFHSASEAGLAISSGTAACNKVGGWFSVLELETSGAVIDRLAIDFMHICEPGNNAVHETIEDPETHQLIFTRRDARLYGSLRINSEIAAVPAPPAGWLLLSAAGSLMARWYRSRHQRQDPRGSRG